MMGQPILWVTARAGIARRIEETDDKYASQAYLQTVSTTEVRDFLKHLRFTLFDVLT